MPTTDQLQAEIDALTTRLNALDGVGLVDPTLASVPTLQRQVNGVNLTLRQSILKMEELYNDLKTTVTAYVTLWRTKFGP